MVELGASEAALLVCSAASSSELSFLAAASFQCLQAAVFVLKVRARLEHRLSQHPNGLCLLHRDS